jgi:hypothetical protein
MVFVTLKKYKKMKKLFAVLVILVATSSLFAQREETIIGDQGLGFSGAWGGWSYNMGQFDKDMAGYNGGLWALEFGKKLYVGGLHYTINNQRLDNNSNLFSLSSNNLLVGYTPSSYRPIHPNLSVCIGTGQLDVTNEQKDRVFLIQPAVGLEFNLVRWCHLDVMAGYRSVMDTNSAKYTNKSFSGFYGQVNMKFGFSWGRYRNGSSSSTPSKRHTERD